MNTYTIANVVKRTLTLVYTLTFYAAIIFFATLHGITKSITIMAFN